jgi:Uncharacterized protein conserved in bacteria
MIESLHPIILYDGVCGLCDRFVQFVMKHDSTAKVRFAALQSETGKELLREFGLPEVEPSFIVLVEGESSYTKSRAVLRALRYLQGPSKYVAVLRFIPSFFSDIVYDFVAHNRYKWFGKYDECIIPTFEESKRFLS